MQKLNGNLLKMKIKISLTIISNDNKITTFFLDKADPFVKRYDFIKGFEEGSLIFIQ